MNCSKRIEAIFKGELVDRVPFALKGWRIPQCEMEGILRNEGLCILDSRPVYSSVSPNIETETLQFRKEGVDYIKTTLKTPKGILSSMRKSVPLARIENTSWQVETMFKTPKDYDSIEFLISDQQYFPDYESFVKAREEVGKVAFFKTGAPGCPLHEFIYRYMDMETFSVEWAENRDRILALCDIISKNNRKIFSIIAKSPAMVVQCGGNYAPEIYGKERFLKHILPHWEEATSILHAGGKLVGCHLDANNKLWAKEVGESKLDWIEAFSPSPDTDMTVAEARRIWAGKVLFVNFPSAVHLKTADEIEKTTKQILKEAAPGDRFILGITENVPENRWRESFYAILKTVNKFGRLPINP